MTAPAVKWPRPLAPGGAGSRSEHTSKPRESAGDFAVMVVSGYDAIAAQNARTEIFEGSVREDGFAHRRHVNIFGEARESVC